MSAEEELWQAYSEQGEPIPGQGLTKQRGRTGLLHAAAHVWVYRLQGERIEVLCQKRAQDKRTFPGCFDASAAGHIDVGETPLQAAVRETEEEIGYRVDRQELRLWFVRHDQLDAGHGIIENEFRWVYGLELDDASASFSTTDGEVDSIVWLSLSEFTALVEGRDMSRQIVPTGKVYYANLLEKLQKRQAKP
jgi:8-oxo-dGTP pyrophosphatase MutT (NUDIX family)